MSWVRAGAIREPNNWSGMAHFLEHMIFKGTDQVPPGVFDQIVENWGGVTNAATSHDYAHFFITTAVPYLADTLPYLAELLLNASIPADEFSRERDVVLEEIRQAEDNPDWLGFQALMESVYECHPYGRPVLGTEMHLLNHSPEEMRSFHSSHYQPENMTVVIVGGVDRESALDMVEHSFQQFKAPSCLEPIGSKKNRYTADRNSPPGTLFAQRHASSFDDGLGGARGGRTTQCLWVRPALGAVGRRAQFPIGEAIAGRRTIGK